MGVPAVELKERFTRALPSHIDVIAEIAARSAKPELERVFRSLAGAAGTHGLEDVASLAAEGEDICSAPFLNVTAIDGVIGRLRDAVEKKRILCVEDDRVQANFLRAVLEDAGYEVMCVGHTGGFDDLLSSFRPDLLTVDVGLPDVSGIDLAREVRGAPGNATLPIIVLTGHRSIEMHIEGLRAGADDYLVKPVSPHLLTTTVASRLERSKVVRALIERDGLTGLLTPRTFRQQLDMAWGDHRRGLGPFTLIAIDIDHFKSINDTNGHAAGDGVLVLLASSLTRSVRRTDPVGRCGGDEMSVLLRNANEKQACALIQGVLEQFAGMTRATSPVTFSAGVALLNGDEDVSAWQKRADDALYAAKRAGRARVEAA